MSLVSQEIAEEIEAALPDGTVFTLPEEWRLILAELPERKESPSSLSSWLACPLKWFLERYAPAPDEQEVTMPSVAGSFVHRVLEVFYSEPPSKRTPDILWRTFNEAWNALTTYDSEIGIVQPLLIQDFRALEANASNPDGLRGGMYKRSRESVGNILNFEVPSEVDIISNEMWVRARYGDMLIRGKIDRLVRTPRGKEVVEDYKGLALDTPIPTPSGWTTMGDLQVGDQVLGSNGLPTKVTVKSQIHNRPCYRITFLDKSQIVADNVHLWEVSTPNADRQVVNTDQLSHMLQELRGEGRPHSLVISNPKPLVLPEQEFDIHPWLLGAWLGDGTSKSGSITTGIQDTDDMETLCKETWTGTTETWRDPDQEYPSYIELLPRNGRVGTNEDPGLVNLLRKHDLYQNKHIPEPYLRGSYEQRLALLQGLMDTDGSWVKDRGRAIFVTTSARLADSVQELVVSLGVTPSRFDYPYENPVRPPAVLHQVLFNPVGFNPFRLPRKASLVDTSLPKRTNSRALRRVITSIEPVESVPTQCIQVDAPDHLYLAGPLMTPTHNTGRPYDGEPNILDPMFLSVGLYAWMRTKMTENTLTPPEVGGVRILYLAHSKRYSVKITPEILEKVEGMIDKISESMDNTTLFGEIQARPGSTPNEYPCVWCPAKALCPVWTDGTFDALQEEWQA